MTQIESKRIDYVDCAKGIGIMLVIIGHTVPYDNEAMHQAIRGSIFSFHMPLFFVLSCITYKLSTDEKSFVQKAERAFKHLIIPLLVVYAIIIIIDILKNKGDLHLSAYIVSRINTLIYASGVNVNVAGATIPALGMMWFMVVLLIGREMYDYICLKIGDKRIMMIVIIVCGATGVHISKLMWLPLSLDIAFAILPFVLFGTWMGRANLDSKKFIWGAYLLQFGQVHCILHIA